jgi:hypothetical protein
MKQYIEVINRARDGSEACVRVRLRAYVCEGKGRLMSEGPLESLPVEGD